MNEKLKKYSRKLRKDQSDAERRLWWKLRSRQLSRYKFRRQYVIAPYIVDFICIWKRLIVELDGGQHAEAVAYDNGRTAYLEQKGYRVLRFWNNVVLEETEVVVETILRELERRE